MLARMTRRGDRSGTGEVLSPVMAAVRTSMARAPTSVKSWWTVVSGGVRNAASGMSSKPTTDTSSGTGRPASCNARNTPSAIWSLPAKTAVMPLSAAIEHPTS